MMDVVSAPCALHLPCIYLIFIVYIHLDTLYLSIRINIHALCIHMQVAGKGSPLVAVAVEGPVRVLPLPCNVKV